MLGAFATSLVLFVRVSVPWTHVAVLALTALWELLQVVWEHWPPQLAALLCVRPCQGRKWIVQYLRAREASCVASGVLW